MSEQHGFYITVEVIHTGDYETAFRKAMDTAEKIGDQFLWESCIVVKETGEETFTGIPNGVYCDCCAGFTIHGVLWPQEKDGDTSRSWVEKCDTCDRYKDDEDAAKRVVEEYRGEGTESGTAPVHAEDPGSYHGYYVEVAGITSTEEYP